MNQKDKYCTPEQAKKLTKLTKIKIGRRATPAFDIPEIMSILPTEIETDKGTAVLWIHRTEDREYEAGYVFKDWKFTVEFSTGEHLAHTLMDLLLWVIDNGYLKVEDIKL